MEHRDLLPKVGGQQLDKLRRQGDFRHQQHGAPPLVKAGADQGEIDRRLAAAGDAVEQSNAGLLRRALAAQALKGIALVRVQFERFCRPDRRMDGTAQHLLLRLLDIAEVPQPPDGLPGSAGKVAQLLLGHATGHGQQLQHRRQPQLVYFLRQKNNGIKAGFTLGRAAGKGGEAGKAIVLRQIPEGEPVAEHQGSEACPIYGGPVFLIQCRQLSGVLHQIIFIAFLMLRVQLGKGGGNFPAQTVGVFQGKPYMLIGLMLVVFLLRRFLPVQKLQKPQYPGLGTSGGTQHIRHPSVGYAAHTHKQITAGDGRHILHRGLIAVQIHAAVLQQRYRHMLSAQTAHPVPDRINGGHDADTFLRLPGGGGCAAGKQGRYHQQRSGNGSKRFFHNDSSCSRGHCSKGQKPCQSGDIRKNCKLILKQNPADPRGDLPVKAL